MNAIRLLKKDHKTVKALLEELAARDAAAADRRTALLEQVSLELEVHAAIEEEIFYPAFRAAAESDEDEQLFFEALEEHRAVKQLVLPDLQQTDTGSEQFAARAKVLKELVLHHARAEEREMFKRATKLMEDAELERIGELLETRRHELVQSLSKGGAMREFRHGDASDAPARLG
ncbi:MAG TPA: hemerythrin domain-containing protein [Myxococcota bacterium]|nr:hemerythrin domain-containing protein [Myxococcota bacterium]